MHPRRGARGRCAQLTDHVEDLDKDNVLRAFLDPAIEFPNPTQAANLEPLLVNTAGSWQHRPDAVTRIPNLFLAADYVRTHTDLATMEGANEAARRAVNGILKPTASSADAVRDLAAARPRHVRAGQGPRQAALEALPPPGQAAAAGHRERRAGADRAAGGRPSARGSGRCSGVDAAEAGGRAAALELGEPERLHRPERAGALDAAAGDRAGRPGHESRR